MIDITLDYNEERAEITGHSGYNEKGKDIVCAAVSALVRVLERAIDKQGRILDDGKRVILEGGGRLWFTDVMQAVEPVLEEIAEKYPENVRVWVRS